MHRLPAAASPLGLVILTACPVEQTYADLIKEHGNTYASETAAPTTGTTTNDASAGDTATPTSTGGDSMSASIGDSSGATAEPTDGAMSAGEDSSGTTGLWIDEPPEIGDLVAPDAVLAAGFVELSVECSDDVGVAEVRFLVDGEPLAAVTEAPFAAKWLVKSQDQIGDHALAVECEDTAGQVVSTGEEISVALPAPGSVGWSKVREASKGSAEAADAAAAPDGSWWVCGHADNVGGGTAVWAAHYSPAGKEIFSKTISRGKDQTGKCSGIAVASDDAHRAVLAGGYGPTGLWPSLWTALVDETEAQSVLAESNDALTGYWGNDVLVNKYGQFEVAGQRVINGDDFDMALQIYSYVPGEKELASAGGMTYGKADFFDAASAIVENPDGTVTLIGTLTKNTALTAAAVRLDAQHQVVSADGWPFFAPVQNGDGSGGLDGALDAQGNTVLTGWWRQSQNHSSQVLTLTISPNGYMTGGLNIEQEPNKGDNAGLGITLLGNGDVVTAAAVTTQKPDNLDIWLRRDGGGSIVFEGAYNLRDEPRRLRSNLFDQTLVVGFETVIVLQDNQPTPVRRAWLRAYH
jgi:hypothetical protein